MICRYSPAPSPKYPGFEARDTAKALSRLIITSCYPPFYPPGWIRLWCMSTDLGGYENAKKRYYTGRNRQRRIVLDAIRSDTLSATIPSGL